MSITYFPNNLLELLVIEIVLFQKLLLLLLSSVKREFLKDRDPVTFVYLVFSVLNSC